MITASSIRVPSTLIDYKWALVIGVPLVVTVLVYAVIDHSKFQGYSAAANSPLSNWGDGSVGMVDFSEISQAPGRHLFYIVRTWFSVVINISSILLILIDSVCLQVRRKNIRRGTESYTHVLRSTYYSTAIQ